MRRNSVLLIGAILVSGCASPQPERVFVSVDRVLAAESIGQPSFQMPKPPGPVPATVVRQPGLPATSVSDRTAARLEAAKKLISENRSRSIDTLSKMLERIYDARAEDEIAKREQDAEPGRSAILTAAVTKLRSAFDAYSQLRSPLVTRLNAIAQSIDLQAVPLPPSVTPHAKLRIEEANTLRSQIRKLDAAYDAQAAGILADAQKEIDAESATLSREATVTRQEARAKALSEAETQATATQASLNVQVTKLIPESLPAVQGRTLTIPGSAILSMPPQPKYEAIFGSLEERRRLIDEQIDIWVKTTGGVRSSTPNGAHDRTEEFLQWRSTHKVGP